MCWHQEEKKLFKRSFFSAETTYKNKYPQNLLDLALNNIFLMVEIKTLRTYICLTLTENWTLAFKIFQLF